MNTGEMMLKIQHYHYWNILHLKICKNRTLLYYNVHSIDVFTEFLIK